MQKYFVTTLAVLISLFVFSKDVRAEPSDYLILQTIGDYHNSGKGKCGKGAGVMEATDHFGEDHNDATCRTGYYNKLQDLAVSVQVIAHPGTDSDKWLLHEVEKSFRTSLGLPGEPFAIRVIDGNTIMVYGSAGWTYRWVSGNKVIQIQYHDSQMEKPEPLEIVKAYLAKHPSTLTPISSAELRTTENKTKWLKDEMERRLWLCEKWFNQLELKKAEQGDALKEVVKSLDVFLKYREKYYKVTAEDERKAIQTLLLQNNAASLKEKLKEYQIWWAEHKTDGINL